MDSGRVNYVPGNLLSGMQASYLRRIAKPFAQGYVVELGPFCNQPSSDFHPGYGGELPWPVSRCVHSNTNDARGRA